MDGDEFKFEMDGMNYIGWVGKTTIRRDKDGVVRMVYGAWQEDSPDCKDDGNEPL